MTTKQIVFTKCNTAELIEQELPSMTPHSVLVQTAVSTLSAGTERANIMGDPNVNPGAGPGVSFPRSAGYSSAGVVIAVGDAVESVQVGDRVVVFWGKHRERNLVEEKNVVKIEDGGISYASAAMSFIATFPMAAIRKTHLEMGESALVMGLGILGMLAVKLLRLAGAVPIVAVDPNPRRRAMALQNGADYALDPYEEGFAERVKEITKGGAKVAIEVTGVGIAFNQALDCMAKFGRIALLGCTRSSDFTVDYYRKIHAPGITVIGAHTNARPKNESHSGWFTHTDDIRAVLRLCAGQRLDLENIIEETHAPEACGRVYERLIYEKDFPVAVQFDWRKKYEN